MMARCFYPSCRSYKWYGAKGITVCLQWRKFAGFLKDMGEAPDGLTIDRKKNHLPYSKGNCRWATPRVQQNNRDNNHRVTFQGKRMTIAEASRATGICPFVIVARINKLKWSEEKALTTPVRKLTPRAA